MIRRFLTFFLAFLLLGMQQEAQLHALTHFSDWLQTSHEQGVQEPQEQGDCLECLLLPGTTSVATVDYRLLAEASTSLAPAHCEVCDRPTDTPSWYSSRAPPLSL